LPAVQHLTQKIVIRRYRLDLTETHRWDIQQTMGRWAGRGATCQDSYFLSFRQTNIPIQNDNSIFDVTTGNHGKPQPLVNHLG
jgi:hypothetical protein